MWEVEEKAERRLDEPSSIMFRLRSFKGYRRPGEDDDDVFVKVPGPQVTTPSCASLSNAHWSFFSLNRAGYNDKKWLWFTEH